MSTLEYCNVDMSADITGARDSFKNLALSDYPVNHVGDLATTTLKLIKIMQQGYAPTVDLGSRTLIKVSDISCDYFNLQVFNLLDKALKMKQK